MGNVRLADIVDGMEMHSDETTFYLHRPTGRVIAISDQAFTATDEDDEELVEPEELAEAREVLARGEDYLALPDRYEIDEYRMMERFASGIADPGSQDQLVSALQGRGAFRRFKDEVLRLDLAEKWYAYRSDEGVARDWCEVNGVELNPGSAEL
jgi:hypothetical protein